MLAINLGIANACVLLVQQRIESLQQIFIAWSSIMAICDLCKEQEIMGRSDSSHKHLKPIGELKIIRGVPTGGYEEQDYECSECGASFTYSNDRYDYGWILHTNNSSH